MSEFMKRLSEASSSSSSGSSWDPATHGWKMNKYGGMLMIEVPAGKTLGSVDVEADEDFVEPTDAASGRAFALELGKRIDFSGLKQNPKITPGISAMRNDKEWSITLDLVGKNGLAAEISVTADRKTGKNIDFEIDAIGPDASNDLVSNDPHKLFVGRKDLLTSLREAASVAQGHAEDVIAFRKLMPDFGERR